MKLKKHIVVIIAVIASLLCLSNAFAVDGHLYASFIGSGIWKWTVSSWSRLTPDTLTQIAAAEANLYGTFTGNGVWQWTGTNWVQLTPDNPAGYERYS